MLAKELDIMHKRNGRKAFRKVSELLKLMKSHFPESCCTTEIDFWEDDTYQVICQYGEKIDGNQFLHAYRYNSSKNEITYSKYIFDYTSGRHLFLEKRIIKTNPTHQGGTNVFNQKIQKS